jgi:hypothetical protein
LLKPVLTKENVLCAACMLDILHWGSVHKITENQGYLLVIAGLPQTHIFKIEIS